MWKALPDALRMLHPNVGMLAGGFALMIVNRVMSLVLPFTTQVIWWMTCLFLATQSCCGPIALTVLAATVIQGLTSYSLTQLISKGAQRMIAELRSRVQSHIGRLPVSYFDSNKTGQLVSRIMNDVEGVRNLIGTGMIDFFGSLLTAILAFGILVVLQPASHADCCSACCSRSAWG